MKTAGLVETNVETIRAYFERHPHAMTLMAAAELKLPEAEVLRHIPGGGVTELGVDRFSDMMGRLESFGDVHVIVSNGATTIEAVGTFGGFSQAGEFFNVQSGSLDMHIRHRRIGVAFAVEKPSHMSGVTTLSTQFYQHDGAAAFKVFLTFGGKPPSPQTRTAWERFRDEFRCASTEHDESKAAPSA